MMSLMSLLLDVSGNERFLFMLREDLPDSTMQLFDFIQVLLLCNKQVHDVVGMNLVSHNHQ